MESGQSLDTTALWLQKDKKVFKSLPNEWEKEVVSVQDAYETLLLYSPTFQGKKLVS